MEPFDPNPAAIAAVATVGGLIGLAIGLVIYLLSQAI